MATKKKPTKSKPVTAAPVAETRTAEKLIALWRYETDRDTGGCCAGEHVMFLTDHIRDLVGNGPGHGPNGDYTAADLARYDRESTLLGDHLLVALVRMGRMEAAFEWLEHIAQQRRECQARFGQARELIPFEGDEQKKLATAWDQANAAAAARAEERAS